MNIKNKLYDLNKRAYSFMLSNDVKPKSKSLLINIPMLLAFIFLSIASVLAFIVLGFCLLALFYQQPFLLIIAAFISIGLMLEKEDQGDSLNDLISQLKLENDKYKLLSPEERESKEGQELFNTVKDLTKRIKDF